MKFTIEIDGAELGTEAAARLAARLAAFLTGGISVAPTVSLDATPAPRQRAPRQPKADAAAATMQAAVDAGLVPAPKPAEEPQLEEKPAEFIDSGGFTVATTSDEMPVEPKPGSPAAEEATASLDELHDKIKANLHKMGAVWARDVISGAHNCKRVGDLSVEAAAKVWTAMQASGNV
jgi:hypothetical protein